MFIQNILSAVLFFSLSADIAEHLCERVLSVLFEIWILACARCFPSPSLWKTFRNMCVDWRHHDALVQQWHRINHALLSRLLKIMYGPSYPELQICKLNILNIFCLLKKIACKYYTYYYCCYYY